MVVDTDKLDGFVRATNPDFLIMSSDTETVLAAVSGLTPRSKGGEFSSYRGIPIAICELCDFGYVYVGENCMVNLRERPKIKARKLRFAGGSMYLEMRDGETMEEAEGRLLSLFKSIGLEPINYGLTIVYE